jgi:hypothetical protein
MQINQDKKEEAIEVFVVIGDLEVDIEEIKEEEEVKEEVMIMIINKNMKNVNYLKNRSIDKKNTKMKQKQYKIILNSQKEKTVQIRQIMN